MREKIAFKSTEQKFDIALYFYLFICYNEKPDDGTSLNLAKLRAEEQIPMTMENWAEQFE